MWFVQMEDAAAKAAKAGPKEIGDIDTDDEQNEEQEYELWKSREMSRIRCAQPVLAESAAGGASDEQGYQVDWSWA